VRCEDYKEQVGAYALGALTPLQSAEMEQHLAESLDHEGCRDELDRARLTVAKLAYSLAPVAPGERVWSQIEQHIRHRSGRASARASSWREAAAWAIAALAIVALVLVNGERSKLGERLGNSESLLASAQAGLAERDRCIKELEQLKSGTSLERDAVALLELPATKVIALKPVGGRVYQASAIVNLEQGRAIIVSTAMPASAEEDLELWVIRGKAAPEPAGFLRHFANGVVLGEVDRQVLQRGAPDALAVSLEPLGGRPTPTEVLLAGVLGG
jgi:anti-sigma-K factor RskA